MLNPSLTLENYDCVIHPCKNFEQSFDISEFSAYYGYGFSNGSGPSFKLYCIRMYLEYQKYDDLKTLLRGLPITDKTSVLEDFLSNNIDWFCDYGYDIFHSVTKFGWILHNNVDYCESEDTDDPDIKTNFTLPIHEPLLCNCESLLELINDTIVNAYEDDFYHFSVSVLEHPLLGAYHTALQNNLLVVDMETAELIDKLSDELNNLFSGAYDFSTVVKEPNSYRVVYVEGYLESSLSIDTSFSYLSLPIAAYWLNKILTELNEKSPFVQKGVL